VLGVDNVGEGDPPAEHAVAKCLVFVGHDVDWLLAELPLEFVRGLVPLGDLALHAPDDLSSLEEVEPIPQIYFDFETKAEQWITLARGNAEPSLFMKAMFTAEGEELLTQWAKRRPLKRTAAWLKRIKANFAECAATVDHALELLSDVVVIRDRSAWQRGELLAELEKLVEWLKSKLG